MSEQDFHIPFSWEERRPYLSDHFLYLPSYFFSHSEYRHLFSLDQIFPNSQKLHIEYCSGNGQWIIDKAKNHPKINWIAVEMRFDRAKKILRKLKKNSLSNLFVVMSEAQIFSKNYLKKDIIDQIYINFPDPWPKKRHEKHRLIEKTFLFSMKKTLKNNSSIIVVTDDEVFSKKIKKIFLQEDQWISVIPEPYHTNERPGYGKSFFENLWKSKGKTIYYMQFSKNMESICRQQE